MPKVHPQLTDTTSPGENDNTGLSLFFVLCNGHAATFTQLDCALKLTLMRELLTPSSLRYLQTFFPVQLLSDTRFPDKRSMAALAEHQSHQGGTWEKSCERDLEAES